MRPRLQHPSVLTLLERFGSPAQIRKAGRRRLVTLLRPKAPRMAERLVKEIFTALDEQTVTVPGTKAAALIVPSLAGSLTVILTPCHQDGCSTIRPNNRYASRSLEPV